jgi:hypothetical protein
MRTLVTTVIAAALTGLSVHAQQPASAAQTTPAAGAPNPAAPTVARVFTAGTGLILNTVRPDRVVDFEMVVAYLQSAFETSTDPMVRAQGRGWRIYKAAEPGPNATVLYVFLIDPTVANADYGLGRILSDAYPDRVQDIWKLYTGALAGGGSLLNLTPVRPQAPPGLASTP